jgi:hypothetical protein
LANDREVFGATLKEIQTVYGPCVQPDITGHE